MTLLEARRFITDRLKARYGEGEASAVARILLEDAFSAKKRAGSEFLSDNEAARLLTYAARLEAGEPLQYLLGQADFFGLKLIVNPSVLIPRQETEELVAWIIEDVRQSENHSPVILDIGTGSGCIAVTAALKLPHAAVYGLDVDVSALETARFNGALCAQKNPVQWLLTDFRDKTRWPDLPEADILVSNPPYIPYSERGLMPEHVLFHEPETALFVPEDDPLLFYRLLAEFSALKLRSGGALYVECNEFNARQAAALFQTFGFKTVTLKKDLSGADRMIKAEI